MFVEFKGQPLSPFDLAYFFISYSERSDLEVKAEGSILESAEIEVEFTPSEFEPNMRYKNKEIDFE